MSTVYLSIGSNIDPYPNMRDCKVELHYHFNQTTWSPVYSSPAVGMEGDDFLNAVVKVDTTQSIDKVLSICNDIEQKQGRVRTSNKFSSRTLDIDMLLYDNEIIENKKLQLPRAEILSAAHVLVPLVDIASEVIHPVEKKTLKHILDEIAENNSEFAASLTAVSI